MEHHTVSTFIAIFHGSIKDDIMTYETGIGNRRPALLTGVLRLSTLIIGLRQFILRVYNFMLAGIGISGLVVYLAVATGFYQQIAGTPLIWIVVLAPPG